MVEAGLAPPRTWSQWTIERRMRRPHVVDRRRLVGDLHVMFERHARWRETAATPGHPVANERSDFSQNGEDGILEAILDGLGRSGGVFWEFGAADGEENCTRALAEQDAWRGLWVEGDPELAARAARTATPLGTRVSQSFVDLEGLGSIVAGEDDPDVLVIDLDGNDYWIWRAIDARPAVVVLEVNTAFGPDERWVMPYDRTHVWGRDRRHGATLRSFTELGERKGYTLVACDGAGVNAFFVHTEDAARFPHAGDRRANYAPPLHRPPTAHPWPHLRAGLRLDPARHAVPQLSIESLERIDDPTGGLFAAVGELVNGSDTTIGEIGDTPVRVGYWWSRQGSPLPGEPRRALLQGIVDPGDRSPFAIVERAVPDDADTLHVALVQEGVAWSHDLDAAATWAVSLG